MPDSRLRSPAGQGSHGLEGRKPGAQLDMQLLAEVRSLHDRKVRIVESWPDDHIPAQTAEARYGRENGSVEPAIHGTEDGDWPHHVRPQRVSHPGDPGVRGYDVHGVAA